MLTRGMDIARSCSLNTKSDRLIKGLRQTSIDVATELTVHMTANIDSHGFKRG